MLIVLLQKTEFAISIFWLLQATHVKSLLQGYRGVWLAFRRLGF